MGTCVARTPGARLVGVLSGADLWREAGGGNAGLLHLSMRIGTPSVLSTWSNLSSGSIGESLTSCCVTTDFFADCCTVRRCSPKIFAVAARARCRSLDSLPEPEEFDLMESALISHAIWARSLALPSPPSPSPSRIAIDPWWVQRMSAQGSKCTESGQRRARDALLRSSLLRTIACFWRRVGNPTTLGPKTSSSASSPGEARRNVPHTRVPWSERATHTYEQSHIHTLLPLNQPPSRAHGRA